MFEALEDGLILVKLLLLNRDIYTNDVLPDNAACTDVEMSAGKLQLGQDDQVGRTHPTSELPISPSLRPTAMPWAESSR